MSENVSPTKESELSAKQQQFIAALIAGNTITVAAKIVGINERTAYRWFQLPYFQEAYKNVKRITFDHALEELGDNINLAISTLKNIMTGAEIDPAVRVRAVKIWIDTSIVTHQNSILEQQQAMIIEKLKEMGIKL